jgi:YbgC/YbaW family acyl-CoA thioester hydrolase
MTPFRITRRVEFHETDAAGIVHFSNFFRYMECAEVEFLRARGLSVKMPWEGEKIGLPRVSATCDFFKSIRFEEEFEIAVTIERLGTKSVTYGFEFWRLGEVIARGKVTSVCCRVGPEHELEPIPIPDRYRELLQRE